jgi:hypothetical protein
MNKLKITIKYKRRNKIVPSSSFCILCVLVCHVLVILVDINCNLFVVT